MRCSICQTLVKSEDPRHECPSCQQVYHRGCWDELGGCATYACTAAATAQKPPLPRQLHGGWGDEKECPRCDRSLGASLLVCACGARFPYPEPMTKSEYRQWTARQRQLGALRKAFVLLFLGSMTAILAPLLGAIAGVLAWTKRRDLAGADGVYLALGCGTALLGTAYACIGILLVLE